MPRRHEHIEWTLEKACSEFGINPRTLSMRVKRQGIEPCYKGKNGKGRFYSTKQMAQAVYGDLESERIGEVRENRERLRLANAKSRGELVATQDVLRVYADLAMNVRQVVKHSGLSDVEKHELLRNIRELSVDDLLSEKTETEGE